MWVIYAAAGGGGVVFIVCVFICCCVVRRAGKERDDEMHSKVKKYQSKDITSEDKIARFKYGRQSIAITLPEIADNQDDMLKPNQDAGWNDQSQYQDGGLEFHQLEDINTNYNNYAPYGVQPQGPQYPTVQGYGAPYGNT